MNFVKLISFILKMMWHISQDLILTILQENWLILYKFRRSTSSLGVQYITFSWKKIQNHRSPIQDENSACMLIFLQPQYYDVTQEHVLYSQNTYIPILKLLQG